MSTSRTAKPKTEVPKVTKTARTARIATHPSRTAKQQLETFIDKFTDEMAAQIRFAHKAMQKHWPTAHRMVYDNYNFLVIGFGSTERTSEAIFSLACQKSGVTLFFLQGTRIPQLLDPNKLLKGSGSTVRSVKLVPIDLINDPRVVALMQAANQHASIPMPTAGKSVLTIRSVSAKQRPRR